VAQLDRIIKILHRRRGQSLTLVSGKPIGLTVGEGTRAVSSEPLSVSQVLGLLREIAPAELRDQVAAGGELRFSYTAPSGDVEVEVQAVNGNLTAAVRPSVTAKSEGAAKQPSAPQPERATPVSHDVTEARSEMDRLLALLVKSGGSDLHLRIGEPPVLRQEGHLVRLDEPSLKREQLQAMLESIMPDRDRAKFADTGDTDFAYELENVSRFRCNAALDRRGPMGVFRVIPNQTPTCEELDISKPVQNLCYLNKGLVLVTGPTGCGKSTTLAALVDLMNEERNDHILTIEDPIEFVHESKNCLVTHRQVGMHTHSFRVGLRAALREDPDIILVGELRDLETVETAIETAETGHLVFGTLHTTTAPSTIDRIIDQFPADRQAQIRVMLSESLRGVIAQILCRKVDGGRVAAREILLSTPAVSNLVREGKTFQIPSIIQTNRKIGMTTLNDSLVDLVERKVIEPKEAYMKSVDKGGIESVLTAKGHSLSFLS
jgi:twitching motility protein PilT